MQYRKFGKLDWQGSALGFGAMRLPVIGRDPTNVDESEAIRMLRYAFDHGVNYVDSAYGYHGGKSEIILSKALQGGYREKVRVATKMPTWLIQSPADYDRYLNEQLDRLKLDKLDFYLMHGLNKERWSRLQELAVLRWAEGAMSKGRFGYLGFSFHDDFETFKGILDAYDNWTLCQIQYNFMDVDYQAGIRGLKYAASKGLAVVIMEPLRGGRLARKPPESVAKLWASSPQKRTPAEWALRWVWNHPEVSVVLSGMSAMEQVVENVATAERYGSNRLTADELALIDQVREAYRAISPIPCTGCRYCMPCPNKVEIPRIFELYNEAIMYDDPGLARFAYRGPTGLKEEERADQCLECGECLEDCPQKIDIPEWLKKAHELLGPKKA